MNNSQVPVARKQGLVVQEMPDEVLIYDLDTNKAHCLNQTAAFVWKSCDGKNTVKTITGLMQKEFAQKVDEDMVWLAIDQLSKESLLEAAVKTELSGLSRREVIKRIGYGAAIALPVVAMLSFPTQALAATCPASQCGTQGTACGGGELCCQVTPGVYNCLVTGACPNPC
jgi:hypothetical protein